MIAEDLAKWVLDRLREQRYQLISAITPFRLQPWSQVYRVASTKGWIYVKQIAEPFAIEVSLLNFLNEEGERAIPCVLAADKALRAIVMLDAGEPMRTRLLQHYDQALAQEALRIYAQIQIKQASTQVWLDRGVLDWRLRHLPTLYRELLLQQEFLQQDGLLPSELQQLLDRAEIFKDLCDKLASYPIEETLEHGDFQDQNILVKGSHITIGDWGDTVITHPFFSMTTFLRSAGKHHGIKEGSKTYDLLLDTYLQQWLPYCSSEQLGLAFELAQCISPVKFCVSFQRMRQCQGLQTMGSFKGIIAGSLRSLIPLL